jgi:hypothetical protein
LPRASQNCIHETEGLTPNLRSALKPAAIYRHSEQLYAALNSEVAEELEVAEKKYAHNALRSN